MKQAEILKIVQSVGGNEFNFDEWYAKGWSSKKGGYSAKLASNLITYLKENRKVVKSCLDVCSGSGEFISLMRNVCSDCVGVDTAGGFINYSQSKYSDVEFKKIEKLYDFKLKKKFDLISCNGDVVNMFTIFSEWQTFFKTIYSHLERGGLFLFDFYTEAYLNSLSGTIYEEGDDLDYVSKRTQNNGLCVMSEIYYLKESSMYYRKTSDIMVETSFPTEEIKKELEKAGFKNIKFINASFDELSAKDLKTREKIYVLAEK